MKKKSKKKHRRHHHTKKCKKHCRCRRPLKRKVRELTEKLECLTHQLNELKQKYYGRRSRKKEDGDENPTPKKKKGAPFGHLPWSRKMPDRIDETEVVIPDTCDGCGSHKLQASGIPDEDHIQEDIVLPKRWVKKFVKKVMKCTTCNKMVRGQGTDEIPGAYIGPRAKAWINTLRYEIGIPQKKIQKMFETLFDMPFVQASVVGFEKKLRERGNNLYEEIKGVIQKAPSRYADETGWKLNGMLRQLWCVCTTRAAYYHIDLGRGTKVIASLLGVEKKKGETKEKRFFGILISDFYRAYDKLKGVKQKCIPHLLRLIKKKEKRFGGDRKADAFLSQLKTLSKQIMELFKHRKRIKNYVVVRADLVARLKRHLSQSIGVKQLDKWRTQLAKRQKELTTCLYHPVADSNNNFVERQLRLSVIMRKITFGNRSEKGIKNHAVIMSLLQTAKLNDRLPADVFHNILVDPSKISLEDILSTDSSRRQRAPP
jgi:transposase